MIEIYTAEQAAKLLACSTKTVEEMARRGDLPGIKPGGVWVFPAGALGQRLDAMALHEAAQRRKPPTVLASTAARDSTAGAAKARRGEPSALRPVLVDLR